MAIFSKNSWVLGFKGLAPRKFTLSAREGRGFTMIELLVVLTVIGLLIAAAGGNYMTSLKRGRDTQRKGDMRKIQQAFEQYYSANQKYDATCANMATGFFVGPYPPRDPRGVSYTTSPNKINCWAGPPSGYCACARLERDGEGNSQNADCNYAPGTYNFFCNSSLQ